MPLQNQRIQNVLYEFISSKLNLMLPKRQGSVQRAWSYQAGTPRRHCTANGPIAMYSAYTWKMPWKISQLQRPSLQCLGMLGVAPARPLARGWPLD